MRAMLRCAIEKNFARTREFLLQKFQECVQ